MFYLEKQPFIIWQTIGHFLFSTFSWQLLQKAPKAKSPSFLKQPLGGGGALFEGLPLDSNTTQFGFLWFDVSLTGNLQSHFSKSKGNRIETSGGKCPENTADPFLSFPFLSIDHLESHAWSSDPYCCFIAGSVQLSVSFLFTQSTLKILLNHNLES